MNGFIEDVSKVVSMIEVGDLDLSLSQPIIQVSQSFIGEQKEYMLAFNASEIMGERYEGRLGPMTGVWERNGYVKGPEIVVMSYRWVRDKEERQL